MKAFLFTILISLTTTAAMGKATYDCQRKDHSSFLLSYDNLESLYYVVKGAYQGELKLKKATSNRDRYYYQGTFTNSAFHEVVTVMLAFNSSIANQGDVLYGYFRTQYYSPKDASVPFTCTKISDR